MKVSVIVPAFNEEKLISGSLAATKAAMSAFTDRGWEAELIVCDNNSTDRTSELAKAAGAKVVFEPFNQIAKARNTGASVATGDWLLFIDADTHPSKALFEETAEVMTDPKCVGGSALVELDEDIKDSRLIAGYWNFNQRLFRWFVGMFHFCRADAFKHVGGNDERLFGSEDVQLSRALRFYGWRRGLRIRLLKRNRINSSARKMHLYSRKEIFRIVFQTIFTLGRNFRKKENCAVWYDGRR